MKLLLAWILFAVQLQRGIGREEDSVVLDTLCDDVNRCDPASECRCDSLCTLYSDCCPQSSKTLQEHESKTECLSNNELKGYQAIVRCSRDWTGDHRKCEGVPNPEDPLTLVPASGVNYTYKNYYCALCNGVAPTLWNLFIEGDDDDVVQSWIEFLFQQRKVLQNPDILIKPKVPEGITIRSCDPNIVRSCPYSWKDPNIKKKCRQYLSPVYSERGIFKNIHCAICHNETLTKLDCHPFTKTLKELTQTTLSRKVEMKISGEDLLKLCKDNSCELNPVAPENQADARSSNDTTENPDYDYYEDNHHYYAQEFIDCTKIPFYPFEYQVEENDEIRINEYDITFNDSYYYKHGESVYVCAEKIMHVENANYSNIFRNCRKMCFTNEEYHILSNNSIYIPEFNHTFEESIIIGARLCVCDLPGDTDEYFQEFLDCVKFGIEKEEYQILDNKTVYIEKYNKHFNSSWYYLNETTNIVYVCMKDYFEDDALENSLSFNFLEHITVACLAISIVCLVLHIVIFCLVAEMRNLAGMNLTSLCFALLLGYCFFLCVTDVSNEHLCLIVALGSFYFFLVSFFWMNTISFDVWRTLYKATKSLRLCSDKEKWVSFRKYSAYAWLSPLVIVTVTVGLEFSEGSNFGLKPRFTKPICWFNNKKALALFFGLPLILLVVANILLFGYSTFIVLRSNVTSADCSSPKRNYKLYIRLAIMTGITWITGIIGVATQSEPIWLIFSILNTLQGLLIFVGFTLSNTAVRKMAATAWRTQSKKSTSEASGSTVMYSMNTRPSFNR